MGNVKSKLEKVPLDKTYHLILDGKHMYDTKFNQEQYNCISNASSVYLREFLTPNDLFILFNDSKIYITVRKEDKEHILDKNKSYIFHQPKMNSKIQLVIQYYNLKYGMILKRNSNKEI